MSELAQRLVSEARTWKGTRFQHQGCLKGIGVDCVNFVTEVARGAGVKNFQIPKNYRPHEDGSLMLKLLNEHMEIVDSFQPGDVLALCDEACAQPNKPRHLVFVSELRPNTTFVIHASAHGVREHRINDHWKRRIHSIWRIKE